MTDVRCASGCRRCEFLGSRDGSGNVSCQLGRVIELCKPADEFRRRYEDGYMYGAKEAFASEPRILRGIPPTVLRLNLTSVHLPLPPIGGPAWLGAPAGPRVFNTFNPSISLAPGYLRRLCSRCAYVMALRADALHQCNASSPLLQRRKKGVRSRPGASFKGTALLMLDAELGIVEWTWLLARPEDQISISHGSSRWFVQPGVSGGFAPPWGKPSYDTRLPLLKEDAHIVHELTHRSTGRLLLFNQEHLLATTTCVGCEFQVYQLEVTAQPTEGGGIRHLRVWSRQRFHLQGVKWAQGRNQAVFSGPVGRRSGPQESALYVRRLGLAA